MRPHIGLEITPSIRLVRPLGAGGMGSVWVGYHGGLNAEVAVKFLSADLSRSEGAQYRFANEASTAAQIKSPHVVQVHDHGIFADELPFIVMELLDGEDLAQRVRRLGTLDTSDTTVLVLQLGHVLAKAHQAGIVHRDVKPENVVLLNGYGELFLKLIDFGIAKRLDGDRALTATGTVVGTPDFMSPEQLLSAKDAGPQVDAWSLAAVAYFALVGVPPFARETVPATFLAIERGDLTLPFQGHGVGSGALDAFFMRALHRDPAARFGTLGELVAAFCAATQVPMVHTLRSGLAVIDQVHGSGQFAAAVEGAERRDAVTRLDAPAWDGAPEETPAPTATPPRPPTTAAGTPVLLARPPPRQKGRLLALTLLLGVAVVLAMWAIQRRPLERRSEPTSRVAQEVRVPWPVVDAPPPAEREALAASEPRGEISAGPAVGGSGGAPGAILPVAPAPVAELPSTPVQSKAPSPARVRAPRSSTAPTGLKDRGF